MNCLYGAHIRIREIHWNTHNQATHNLTNSLMPDIMEYIDTFMELISGISDRPGFDIIKPVIPSSKDLTEILKALSIKSEMSTEILTEQKFRGVLKTIDDMIADLNKWVYLSSNF